MKKRHFIVFFAAFLSMLFLGCEKSNLSHMHGKWAFTIHRKYFNNEGNLSAYDTFFFIGQIKDIELPENSTWKAAYWVYYTQNDSVMILFGCPRPSSYPDDMFWSNNSMDPKIPTGEFIDKNTLHLTLIQFQEIGELPNVCFYEDDVTGTKIKC